MIQDLEDLGAGVSEDVRQPVAERHVWRHVRSSEHNVQDVIGAMVPEMFSVWVKTFGCAHNTSDSEYMMGQLQDYGFRRVNVVA
jgi:hypothetical protein